MDYGSPSSFNRISSKSFSVFPPVAGAYLLQKRRNVPYCVFLGGRDVPSRTPDPPYYRWLYLLLKPAIRAIWRNAAAVVVCSEGLRELAQETDSNIPMDVIPDAVDLETFTPVQRNAYPEKVRVLTIGRLIPRKGFQFLIRALPQVLEKVSHNFENRDRRRWPVSRRTSEIGGKPRCNVTHPFCGFSPLFRITTKIPSGRPFHFTLTRRGGCHSSF